MRGNALKWTLLGGAIVFIVLYGIEMSSAGIERVNGSFGEDSEYVVNEEPDIDVSEDAAQESGQSYYAKKIEELEKELEETKRLVSKASGMNGGIDESGDSSNGETVNERLPGIPVQDSAPAVDKLAESASGMLQSVSSGGIRWVVSIFDGLTN